MIEEQFGQFWLQLNGPLKATWNKITDSGIGEIEGNLATYWPAAASPHEPSLNQCGVLIPRDDHRLVQVVEEMRGEANGHCAELKVVTIPDDVEWVVLKKNGKEYVSEQHRTWS